MIIQWKPSYCGWKIINFELSDKRSKIRNSPNERVRNGSGSNLRHLPNQVCIISANADVENALPSNNQFNNLLDLCFQLFYFQFTMQYTIPQAILCFLESHSIITTTQSDFNQSGC